VTGLEPQRESQRLTPAPVAARAAVDPEAKLTPKAIVNVGESTPPLPSSLPSPFRAANDAPRRSPIPMPASGTPRANGASGHAAPGPHTNGVRSSRTKHGLSATPASEPESSPDNPTPTAPSSRPRSEAEVSRASFEQRPGDDTPPFAAAPVERSALGAQTRRAPAATASLEPAPAASASAPGSNPESEQEFFEAGDEGTYAGGPRSGAPVPHSDRDPEQPSAALQRITMPSRSAGARRRMHIVGGVLLLAAVPLIVAAWRYFAAEQQAAIALDPGGAAASEQFAPPAVKQPGNTGSVVASTPSAVSLVSDTTSIGADAATPMVPDGSAPFVRAAPPGAPATLPPPVVPSPRSVPEPASAPPKAAAAPRPRPPARAPSAPTPKPPNVAETPLVPPLEPAPPSAASRPGEKPPTAAYPLH
jgi:hypothetical protein